MSVHLIGRPCRQPDDGFMGGQSTSQVHLVTCGGCRATKKFSRFQDSYRKLLEMGRRK